MTVRRRAREIALQVLYQLDIGQGDPREVLGVYFENFRPSEKAREFCHRLIEGVWQHREEIDRLIEENAENWTLKRMAVVDRNILRIAAYELTHCPDIPFKATLNEAIELAKRFGNDDSGAFINGILDKVHSLSGPALQSSPPAAKRKS
jgi:N utilization substance protein B